MENNKDKQVQELFKVVQAKKAEISKAEKPNYETNLSFRYNPDSSLSTNIQVCANLEELVGIAAFLLEKEQSFSKANELLGTNCEFKWLGYTREQWINDLRTRINKIQISTKKKELDELDKRLNGLVSKDLRDQWELEDIMTKLKA